MADKRISQLTDRGTVANNDVVAIVVSGAVTTNKATISSIQTFMQGNLDLGVTSVGITLGSTGTDVSVTGSPITTSGNITINIPTASAVNRGVLSAADYITFNSKQGAITLTTTGTSGAATFVSNTLNIPNYAQDLSGFVTLGTAQTITAQKTFTGSGSSDTMIISHGSGSGFALDVIKAGNGEVMRVLKTSGSGNAMTVQGGNFEAPTIVKTGGTSSQFLMADGSVNTSVLASGAYLPLVGGTLTGALNGTSGVFTSSLQSQTTVSAINSTHAIGLTANVGGFNRLETTGTGPLSLVTAGSSINLAVAGVGNQFTLTTASLSVAVPYSGTSATLTGALNGTSAVFSGAFEAGRTGGDVTRGDLSVDTTSTASKVIIGRLSNVESDNTTLVGQNRVGGQGWSIDSFGVAAFNSSVTATKLTSGGNLELGTSSGDNYILKPGVDASGTGSLIIQAGFGSAGAGGAITLYSHSHATYPGGVFIGRSAGASGPIIFGGGGTSPSSPQMTITSAGNVGIGTATPAATVKLDVVGDIRTSTGILFGADTAAANALDDYEEGTWTPGITFGGASVGVGVGLAVGKYTKVGRQVNVNGFLVLSSKGSSVGQAEITGLPFTNFNSFANYSTTSIRVDNLLFANQYQAFCQANVTNINLEQTTELGVTTNLNNTNFANNTSIMVNFTYYVS